MSMITKKLCLVGSFAVGKTSLVKQFVHSIFSDKYLSTVGVKISKKVIETGEQSITLMLWDLEGQDCFAEINKVYLRGAAGFLIVADSTRKETLNEALALRLQVLQHAGDIPNLLLLNKTDLVQSRDISDEDLALLDAQEIKYFETSAKTGESVEEAFVALAEMLV